MRTERFWEAQAQGLVRSLRPPVGPGENLDLAWYDGELVAVCLSEPDGPDAWHIEVLAVHLDHQRSGIGRACLSNVLELRTADAAESGASMMYITASIWHENYPSQRLFRSFGFDVIERGNVDQWAAAFPV